MRADSTSVLPLIEKHFPLVHLKETVAQVLLNLRSRSHSHKVIYLYVVDENQGLLGVLPVHRLLTAAPETIVETLYLKRCVSLPEKTTVAEARKAFSEHRYLAFPVVDTQTRVVGVLSIEQFAGDLGDISAAPRKNDLFELFGLHTGTKGKQSTLSLLRLRIPWLGATFCTGLCAALLTEHFKVTLQQAVSLSFFLTLVLGLNESVAMQSTTLTVNKLHTTKANFKNLLESIYKELACAVGLGAIYGLAAGSVVYLWQGDISFALLLSAALTTTMTFSCLWGVIIPFFLHRTERDPKVASGPLVLGLSDLTTLGIYFFGARLVL